MAENTTTTTHTIRFRNPGLKPPVYVLGTFTDPEWQDIELQAEADGEGADTFTTRVHVQIGVPYQYKFRQGAGTWLLNTDEPTATDDKGNVNNLLKVSRPPQHQSKSAAEATIDPRLVSSTHAGTTAASNIDTRRVSSGDSEEIDDNDVEELTVPLLAHESLGDYHVVGSSETDVPQSQKASAQPRCVLPLFEDVNAENPLVEQFPCNKSAVLETLRKLQSSLDEDQVHLNDIPPSFRDRSRRESIESNAVESNKSASPLAESGDRLQQNGRSLYPENVSRSRSTASLGSIAEEAPLAPEDGKSGPMPRTSDNTELEDRVKKSEVKPAFSSEQALEDHGDVSLEKVKADSSWPSQRQLAWVALGSVVAVAAISW